MIAVKEQDLNYIKDILSHLPVNIAVERNQDIVVKTEAKSLHSVLNALKLNSFSQLTLITCIDFIKEDKFNLIYIVYSIEKKIEVFVSVYLDRKNPVIDSVLEIYPNALGFEMEIAEMFGVNVKGNNRAGKPFVLENWKEMPPLRKDFDSIAFVNSHYIFRERRETTDGTSN